MFFIISVNVLSARAPLIVVSFDGFRYDYTEHVDTPSNQTTIKGALALKTFTEIMKNIINNIFLIIVLALKY
jgi:hypothetical protein